MSSKGHGSVHLMANAWMNTFWGNIEWQRSHIYTLTTTIYIYIYLIFIYLCIYIWKYKHWPELLTLWSIFPISPDVLPNIHTHIASIHRVIIEVGQKFVVLLCQSICFFFCCCCWISYHHICIYVYIIFGRGFLCIEIGCLGSPYFLRNFLLDFFLLFFYYYFDFNISFTFDIKRKVPWKIQCFLVGAGPSLLE